MLWWKIVHQLSHCSQEFSFRIRIFCVERNESPLHKFKNISGWKINFRFDNGKLAQLPTLVSFERKWGSPFWATFLPIAQRVSCYSSALLCGGKICQCEFCHFSESGQVSFSQLHANHLKRTVGQSYCSLLTVCSKELKRRYTLWANF